MSPLPPPVAPPLLMARVAFPLGIWNVPVYTPSFSVRATELPFRVAVGTCPSAGATLLRYILQNPLKAGIVQSVSVYPWSSWGEYTGSVPPALSLCATNVVLKRMPLSDLQELVDAPLSDDVMILDIDDNPRGTIGDHEVRQYLLDHFQISKPLNIQALDKEQRNQILLFLLDLGAGFRQISRITGVPYGVIHRLNSKR